MQYTIKWWRDDALKPVGIEYQTLNSPGEIESSIRGLVDSARAKRVEVSGPDGVVVAHHMAGKTRFSSEG